MLHSVAPSSDVVPLPQASLPEGPSPAVGHLYPRECASETDEDLWITSRTRSRCGCVGLAGSPCRANSARRLAIAGLAVPGAVASRTGNGAARGADKRRPASI